MGLLNSSQWRVEPVFDALIGVDKTGAQWLPTLLGLPTRAGRERLLLTPERLGPLEEAAWTSSMPGTSVFHPAEKALPAPTDLLRWLVENVDESKTQRGNSQSKTAAKRRLLGQRDSETRAEALELLRQGRLGKEWQVLEGPSFPDVYLRTKTVVVVIEGKLTERAPTTQTKWLDDRHQMLRHIDSAWDTRDRRSVYGFFIIDDEETEGWKNAASQTISPETLKKSLPHRSDSERAQIADAFLGITTWRKVRDATGLPHDIFRELPAR
jgi:hypothetical protein